MTTPLSSVKAAYVNALGLSDDDAYIAEAILCVYLCNVLACMTEPVWMQIIGPPSSHKTESLRPLFGYSDTIDLSSLTVNSLISGYRDPNNNDPSLILMLNRKVLVIKDFTTVHSMDKASRDKIYGDFRDAFDGMCSKASGTVGLTRYTAKFGVLCAVTEVVDAFAVESQQLGERFLSFRTFRYPMTHQQQCSYLRRVLQSASSKDVWRAQLRQTVHQAITAVKQQAPASRPHIPDTILNRIIIAGHLLAQLRTTPVNQTPISAEMASRVVQQLAQLGCARAIADQRPELNGDDLTLIYRVALDTLPTPRRRILMTLYHSDSICPPPMSPEQIARMSRTHLDDVKLILNQYVHTRIAVCEYDGKHTKYALHPEIRHLVYDSQILTPGPHMPIPKLSSHNTP